MTVPRGSGVVEQTITISGAVVGTSGDIVVNVVSKGGGLVVGLTISPSTHGTCAQTLNNGYTFAWRCLPSPTWGAGTIAVRLDTGSSNGVFPPGTTDWPGAETAGADDAAIPAAATSTLNLLAPPAKSTPPASPPVAPTHSPTSTGGALARSAATKTAGANSAAAASSSTPSARSSPTATASGPGASASAQAAAPSPVRSASSAGVRLLTASSNTSGSIGLGVLVLMAVLLLAAGGGTAYLLRRRASRA